MEAVPAPPGRAYSLCMELGRYFPLSNRPQRDESGVSRDWAPREAEVRRAVVEQLGVALGPNERRGIRGLVDALVDAYTVAEGRHLELDPTTTGAVALYLLQRAPTEIKAVVRDRRLVATDAGWELGSGREVRATAPELVLFLAGRGPFPG